MLEHAEQALHGGPAAVEALPLVWSQCGTVRYAGIGGRRGNRTLGASGLQPCAAPSSPHLCSPAGAWRSRQTDLSPRPGPFEAYSLRSWLGVVVWRLLFGQHHEDAPVEPLHLAPPRHAMQGNLRATDRSLITWRNPAPALKNLMDFARAERPSDGLAHNFANGGDSREMHVGGVVSEILRRIEKGRRALCSNS